MARPRKFVRLFKPFEKVEIWLRICRLLKVCDLRKYDGHKFASVDEIDREAEANLAANIDDQGK